MERDNFSDYSVISDLVDEFVTTEHYSPSIDSDKFIEAIKREPYKSFILGVIGATIHRVSDYDMTKLAAYQKQQSSIKDDGKIV